MIAVEKVDFTMPDFRRISDRVTRGETVLIHQPTSTNLIVLSEDEYNQMAKEKKARARASFKETMNKLHQNSIANGTADMTIDEINAVIKESRAERRAKREQSQ